MTDREYCEIIERMPHGLAAAVAAIVWYDHANGRHPGGLPGVHSLCRPLPRGLLADGAERRPVMAPDVPLADLAAALRDVGYGEEAIRRRMAALIEYEVNRSEEGT